jgi:two-component system, NarL family, response regulator NreC
VFPRIRLHRSETHVNSAEQIRIVLLDEHSLVRAGLRALLSPASEVNVVGEASDAREAAVLVRQTQAQVLIVHRAFGGDDGAAVAGVLDVAGVKTNLLLLTMQGTPSALEALLAGGARGYLTRTATDRDLIDAVRTVAHGAIYRCLPVAAPLASDRTVDIERRRFEKLTEREREVLVSTAHGYSAPEIGARLKISAKTVDTYKQRIHEKLGVHHRTDYVRMALRLHLMDAL